MTSLFGLSLLIVGFIGRQSNAANVTISHQIAAIETKAKPERYLDRIIMKNDPMNEVKCDLKA